MYSPMVEEYLSWPHWFSTSLTRYGETVFDISDHIVVCGMGGSGAAGDYVRSLSAKYSGPRVDVVKDFTPDFKARGGYTLVAVSYSGNTVETLHCAEQLEEGANSVVAIASGGKLLDISRRKGWTAVELPQGLLPRVSFPWMYGALVAMVSQSLRASLGSIIGLAEGISRDEAASRGKKVSRFLSRFRMVSVAGCGMTIPLAIRAKNELAENSKMPVKLEIYPESSHNDIVALEGSAGLYGGLLISGGPGHCSRVMQAVETIYKEYGVETLVYDVSLGRGFEADVLEYLKVTQAIGIASVYLAEGRGIDPRDTRPIERYKKLLS